MRVAFIGLGVMGYPMAGYISKAGHDVTVYNRTKSKAEKWIKEFKGRVADTPKEAENQEALDRHSRLEKELKDYTRKLRAEKRAELIASDPTTYNEETNY